MTNLIKTSCLIHSFINLLFNLGAFHHFDLKLKYTLIYQILFSNVSSWYKIIFNFLWCENINYWILEKSCFFQKKFHHLYERAKHSKQIMIPVCYVGIYHFKKAMLVNIVKIGAITAAYIIMMQKMLKYFCI